MKYKCPFCEKELADAQTPCCGEAGHAVPMEECAHDGGWFGASDGHNYCLKCNERMSA